MHDVGRVLFAAGALLLMGCDGGETADLALSLIVLGIAVAAVFAPPRRRRLSWEE